MRVALLGGTGDIGEGIALRLARDTDHEVVIGSRDAEKAERRAGEYVELLGERGHDVAIEGYSNSEATATSDVVVASVPPEYAVGTVETVADDLDDGDVLVCPATQMDRDGDGFHYDPPAEGSVAEAVAAAAPDGVPVVGAFQNVAAGALTNLGNDLAADVILTGDSADAKATVGDIVEAIDGLRALDAGGLANSPEVEAITPLLINLAMNNDGMHDLGVRFQ
ncbi:NADPH-dependent F420 reductase [Natrinema gelatinilyticum]|uniref:NADPH-dependent F420 reductase n=1 Tax=Natrinema gelatinilyticum TaxID=2961571 RepID=UPI0020C44A66|nr:NADPH-dependent F420 reductase [Natrinema gelatinilyticum]